MRGELVSIALAVAALIAMAGLMQLAVMATEVLILIDCKQTGAHNFGGAAITCQAQENSQ